MGGGGGAGPSRPDPRDASSYRAPDDAGDQLRRVPASEFEI